MKQLQTLLRLSRYKLLLVAFLFVFVACKKDKDSPTEEEQRGEIIETTVLAKLSTAQIDSIYKKEPVLTAGQAIKYPIEVYKIKYKTASPLGGLTNATGVVAIPVGKPDACHLMSFQHGTSSHRKGVPSYFSAEYYIGVVSSTSGYVTCLPDYLGLGDSDFPFHPYIHAKSEATATIDLLRAAKKLLAEKNVSLTSKLFLAGYSQGGHATMAAHREIQQFHSSEFTVTASAPMAGPHDVSGAQVDMLLLDTPYYDPSYLPFLMNGYNKIYKMYSDLSIPLKAEYVESVMPLFDGNHSTGDINKIMPEVPKLIVKDEVLADFLTNQDHVFRKALRDNDTWNWVPTSPVRMFHCSGDDAVTFQNSVICRQKMIDQGANPDLITVVDEGEAPHFICALPSILSMQAWFKTME